MHSTVSRMRSPAVKSALVLMIACAALAAGAAGAQASPGALKIATIDSFAHGDTGTALNASIAAQPGVAQVTPFSALNTVDGGAGTTPSLADIAGFDAVVILNDYTWADQVALGSTLADFVDKGGVAVIGNWTFWDTSQNAGYALLGRWATGNYSPFDQTQSGMGSISSLTGFNAAHPFFAGVSALTNGSVYNGAVAAGATQLASWANGQPAIAVKGHVMAINGLLDDNAVNSGGAYGALVVNSIKSLAPQTASVKRAGSGKGTVTSSPVGIACGAICSGAFASGSTITYSARAAKNSVFAGWGTGCSGTGACAITAAYPGGSPAQWATPTVTAQFASTKLKIGKLSKGMLAVRVPGAGKLAVSGSGIVKSKASAKAAGSVKIKIKATGSLARKLAKLGSVKVKLKFVFTPRGAAKGGKTTTTVTLKS